MSILNQLASSLNRRDETPNQELAKTIVQQKDTKAVQELVSHLKDKNKAIRHDCIKVLYEIGEQSPALIANEAQTFIGLLDSADNRMQWGAMTAIHTITNEVPQPVYHAIGKIMAVAEKGSVITKDNAVNILVQLCNTPAYRNNILPLLKEQLLAAAENQLPMYAERILPVIDSLHAIAFIEVLHTRLQEIEKASKRTRIEKVIKKLQRL